MTSLNDYIIFVDESGDHSLESIDKEYPVFVLAFCIFKKLTYAETIVPNLIKFKFKYFNHDQVILHERDIRKAINEFSILQKSFVREAFQSDLSDIIKKSEFAIASVIIDKNKLKNQSANPTNPYHLGLKYGLDIVSRYLTKTCDSDEGTLHILFENRGKKEDSELVNEFHKICNHNESYKPYPFKIIILNKHSNSSGLQLADLVARPIGRYVLNKNQHNRAFNILCDKLICEDEKFEGVGLKVVTY